MSSCLPVHRGSAVTSLSAPRRFLFALLLTLAMAPQSPGVPLFTDAFNYVAGEKLGEGSSASSWANPKSNITIGNGSLSYPGVQASDGNHVVVNGGTSSLDGARTASGSWTSQNSGTLYVSFLLQLHSTDGVASSEPGTPIVNISAASAVSQQLISLNLIKTNGVKLGVCKYPSSNSSVSSAFFASGPGSNLSADSTSTYLVVAKYQWVSGTANDIVTVWVNPSNLGGNEDPANGLSTSAGADGSGNAGRLYINRGPSLSIDELRIGQTWAEVTPTSGAPVAGQPRITEAYLRPEGFILRGTNGSPTGVYRVQRAGPSPASGWISTSTNHFDAQGNFASTNTVSGDAREYFRLLTGGELPTPPAISSHPKDLSVLEGQSATFNVVATGTAPLSFRWFFDDLPIPGAFESSLTITPVANSNAGSYRVVITNSIGSVTSVAARLNVVLPPEAGIPDGYAAVGSGTTGGLGGQTVTASTLPELAAAVGDSTPRIVLVQGTIHLGSSNVRVRDNKTILGLGTNAVLVGDLKIDGNHNVIIRNLTFTNPSGAGDRDGLTLQDCRNVWVDHCTFVDCDDGSLDISHGADWITVSWCHFYYTDPGNTHRFANLVGHSDNNAAEDAGRLHVTFHHNWWGQLVHERMPRVRFGRVHLFNNYFNSPGNNNCIRAARDSEILVENNYFDAVKNVWEVYRTTGADGKVFAAGNVQVNTTWSAGDSASVQVPGTDELSNEANGLNPLPYFYTLDPAAGIPAAVTHHAGAGKGPFAP